MPERDRAAAGRDQPRVLGGVEHIGVQPELGHGAQDRRRVPSVVRRSHQQSPLRALRQVLDALAEHRLQARRQRDRLRESTIAAELGVRQGPGQLEQGEWVAIGLEQQSLTHARRSTRRSRSEDRRGGVGVQASQCQLGKPGSVESVNVSLAGAEHDRHALGSQPPGREHDRVRRRSIEPLRVVDQTEHRNFLGRSGEQAEHRG